jgi:hypothetical protein
MKTYVVLRRGAWDDSEEVQAVAQRSLEVGEEMHEDVRWIRSYILEEPGEFYGTVCIYEARSSATGCATGLGFATCACGAGSGTRRSTRPRAGPSRSA